MVATIIALVLVGIITFGCMNIKTQDVYSNPRDKIFYGYYGDMEFQYNEVKDHVNMIWIAAWDRHPRSWVDVVYERIIQAANDGKKSVVMMTTNTYIDGRFSDHVLKEIDELFQKLDEKNALANIIAIYPTDEPDGSEIASEEIAKGNAAIRSVMDKYPALKDTALAVFYTGSEKYPGIEYYDWVGFDEYHKGEQVLGAKYRRMLTKLRPNQRTMIIPGGCDKWRQDPKPFVDFALENPRVIAVVPFIWIDNAAPGNNDVGLGIRSNGMTEKYRQAGLTLINNSEPR